MQENVYLVDWAALAKQWITQRETVGPVPPMMMMMGGSDAAMPPLDAQVAAPPPPPPPPPEEEQVSVHKPKNDQDENSMDIASDGEDSTAG